MGEPEVGRFERGHGLTRAALARYLVSRALMRAIDQSMYAVALVVTVVAILVFAFWIKWLGVLIFLIAVAVLAFRALFMAVLRRLAGPLWSIETRIRGLVGDSRSDLLAELKRLGLPHSTLTLPLFLPRLIGRRRAETLERLRGFEVSRVIPARRLDELHLIVENEIIGRRGPAGDATN